MRPLAALFLVCTIDVLGFGILIPLIPYMAGELGAAPQVITAILGVYSLSQLLAAPFWGRLSDRYGRRPILMSSLAGACVSYVMLGFADSIAWIFAARILAGFMAGNLAAAFAYAADVSRPEDRAKAMGLVGAAIGVGFAAGPALGGLLAGEQTHSANFALPAAVSAALSLVAIALVHFLLPESRTAGERRTARSRQAGLRPLALLASRPRLRTIAAAALLVTCSQSMLESIFAIWAWHKFDFGPRTVGVLLFALACIVIAMQGGGVRVLAGRLGERRLAMSGAMAYVGGLAAVAAAGPSLAVTLAGLALCGVGAGAFGPGASALASRQAGPEDRGAVMGTYQAASSLARAVTPFATGWIYAALGTDAPFIAGALIAMPAIWLVRNTGSDP